MDEKTKKAVIARNLENWYIIDSVLFNAHARQVIKEGKVFKEYIALKASLLSNLYEYWQHVKYTPVDTDVPGKVKVLQESAVVKARKGKATAAELLTRDKFKSRIKNHIVAESKRHKIKDLKTFQAKVVEEKFKQFALDNCLIGMPLLESKNLDTKCNFECKILEDAHRLMRDNLVRMSLTCSKKKSLTEGKKLKILGGLLALAGGVAVGKRLSDVSKWNKYTQYDPKRIYAEKGASFTVKVIRTKWFNKITDMIYKAEDKITEGTSKEQIDKIYATIGRNEAKMLMQSSKEMASMIKVAKTIDDKNTFKAGADKESKKAKKVLARIKK